QAGQMAGWNPDQQNFALRAVGSQAALQALLDQLKGESTTPAVRQNLIERIAGIGGQPGVGALFDLALANPMRDANTQAEILAALVRMARTENARPPQHPERLESLMESRTDALRAEALRLAGAWKRVAWRPRLL